MRFSKILFNTALKKTTGIYGINVVPNARPQLISVYKQTLDELKEKIPPHAVYRQATEALTAHRLSVVNKFEDVTAIETELASGQIEQLLIAAQEELRLVSKMAEWKPWEPLQEVPVQGQWDYFKKAPVQE
ncbi:NADH dehydrogenase [ubiquinone] 1 alpha subcomplex subunit 5 [Smittium mucronatum]|uniref:NADH dehydrogenase [ubiquinone] 1 alpha subcomplex subunit 5 n=1 Tax=Smittium mucronatum TaxID=133383 RepID=A0A1R0GUA0_9FUNG|nr:NADH dehydrogenase [ubiquinone] 1 alpha subcomplex subunit 5 [Smittium mucronatum]